MGDTGFDSPLNFTRETANRQQSDAESDAAGEACGGEVLFGNVEADLATIAEAWPMLSADARRALLDIVERELCAVGAVDRGS